jgi:hypothetical protein
MDRAGFSEEATAKEFEDAIRVHERSPKPMGGGRVVGRMDPIL